jgi:hypothetical protein
MKNIIIASTSTVHGSGFLDYLLGDLKKNIFRPVIRYCFFLMRGPGVPHMMLILG